MFLRVVELFLSTNFDPRSYNQEAGIAVNGRLPQLPDDACEPDEQRWRPARSHPGQYGSLDGRRDTECLRQNLVGRARRGRQSGSGERVAGVPGDDSLFGRKPQQVNVNPKL